MSPPKRLFDRTLILGRYGEQGQLRLAAQSLAAEDRLKYGCSVDGRR